MSAIRKVSLVVLAFVLFGVAGLLYWSSRTETGYLAARPLTRYQQITEDDLVPVSLPGGRPAEFQVVTSRAALVGHYAAEPVVQGALFTPGLVIPEPPTLRVFRSGKPLPEGLRAYPLILASGLGPELEDTDLVDVILVEPAKGTATWLLSNIEPLTIYKPGDVSASTPATYILALTAEQVALLEGTRADAASGNTGAYFTLVLSQNRNQPIQPGTRYPYRELQPSGN